MVQPPTFGLGDRPAVTWATEGRTIPRGLAMSCICKKPSRLF
jgi:hypothetical protein